MADGSGQAEIRNDYDIERDDKVLRYDKTIVPQRLKELL